MSDSKLIRAFAVVGSLISILATTACAQQAASPAPAIPDSVHLVFIKNVGGCHACSTMTRCVLRTMDTKFVNEKKTKKLSFEVITLADSASMKKANHFGGRVKTLAVARWSGGREVDFSKVDSLLDFGDDTLRLQEHIVKRIHEALGR